MLKRIHIRGYKSLEDVEVHLPRLAVLFGPNAVGKGNLLDAIQLLSKLATSRTLSDAFAPPHRGRPLESFTFGEKGIKGLLEQDALSFSIEADLSLSDAVVEAVHCQISKMRSPCADNMESKGRPDIPISVCWRDLRYRLEVVMSPRTGALRVADEYLAALNAYGVPTDRRRPFIEYRNQKIHVRAEGRSRVFQYDRYLDHSILSMPHYVPYHPHLTAARRELENWLFIQFEPRERMRVSDPLREVRQIGQVGDGLGAFLHTLKTSNTRQFMGIEKALHMLMPDMDGIKTNVSDRGEIELRLKEGGIVMPANLLSDGTLRMLGLLAVTGFENAPSLVVLKEPERGVYPNRIQLVMELLKTQESLGETQYIVTTHSPILPDMVMDNALLVANRIGRRTRIDPVTDWGPLRRGRGTTSEQNPLPVSWRILRGDFCV